MKHNLLAVFAVLALVSCGHKALPDGVLNEAQMVDFLSEAYLIEGFYAVETRYNYDTLADQARADYEALLRKQGIKEEQVAASFDYYAHHTDAYAKIHKRVVDRLDGDLGF